MSATDRTTFDPQEIYRVAKKVAAVEDKDLRDQAVITLLSSTLMAIARGGNDPESLATAALQSMVVAKDDLRDMMTGPVMGLAFNYVRTFVDTLDPEPVS
jgi:hypothetical protein